MTNPAFPTNHHTDAAANPTCRVLLAARRPPHLPFPSNCSAPTGELSGPGSIGAPAPTTHWPAPGTDRTWSQWERGTGPRPGNVLKEEDPSRREPGQGRKFGLSKRRKWCERWLRVSGNRTHPRRQRPWLHPLMSLWAVQPALSSSRWRRESDRAQARLTPRKQQLPVRGMMGGGLVPGAFGADAIASALARNSFRKFGQPPGRTWLAVFLTLV